MSGTKNGSMTPRWGIGLAVLVAIGVFGSDAVRTGLVKSSVTDDATQIAHDAANDYHNNHNVDLTYSNAQAEAASKGASIPSTQDFSVTGTGTVSLTLAKVNSTLVLGRLDASMKVFTAQSSSTWEP